MHSLENNSSFLSHFRRVAREAALVITGVLYIAVASTTALGTAQRVPFLLDHGAVKVHHMARRANPGDDLTRRRYLTLVEDLKLTDLRECTGNYPANLNDHTRIASQADAIDEHFPAGLRNAYRAPPAPEGQEQSVSNQPLITIES